MTDRTDAPLPQAVIDLISEVSPLGQYELLCVLRAQLTPTPSATTRRITELGPLAELLRTHPETVLRTQLLRGGVDPGATAAEDEKVLAALPRRQWREISRQDYDRMRPSRAEDAKTLIGRYGSWSKVCLAADGLLPDGRYVGVSMPWSSAIRGRAKQAQYTREEIIEGIRQCAFALLRRPSSNAYITWSRARRDHLRRHSKALHPESGKPMAPRVADWGTIRSHFGGYPQALAAAQITDTELAAARARRALPGGRVGGATPAERLRALTPAQLTHLGLTGPELEALATKGFGHLTLAQATAAAVELNGSLDWLAGRAPDPGTAASPTAVLDVDRLRALRDERQLSDAELRKRLGLAVGPWRRMLSGKDDPPLAWLAHLAGALNIPLDALVRDADRSER